jgi:hypothetical protein
VCLRDFAPQNKGQAMPSGGHAHRHFVAAAKQPNDVVESAAGAGLPIQDVCFHGECRQNSGQHLPMRVFAPPPQTAQR